MTPLRSRSGGSRGCNRALAKRSIARRSGVRLWSLVLLEKVLAATRRSIRPPRVRSFAGSELLPLFALPIPTAGVLSPDVICAAVPLPVVRMNHHVRVWRIVIPLHRMPAGRAGLIADDGRRRAVSSIVTGAVPLGAPGRRLARRWASRLRAQKLRSPTAQLSRNISLETPCWILPIRGIMPRQRYVSRLCSGPPRRFFGRRLWTDQACEPSVPKLSP
jgi:hypothetical protein